MKAHEKIGAAILDANKSGRTALVPFFTAGYPDPQDFITNLQMVADCGDVVEIGIPFSDPMAEGETIQRASHIAIENGVTLSWIFDQLESAGDVFDTPLVMMSYLNPLMSFGYEKLAARAIQTGVCAFIVPDLPLEESDDIRTALDVEGVGLIQLVTPATPDDRLRKLANASRGFLYAVTITGITGGAVSLPDDLTDYLDKISALSTLPVCAGFGIRNATDVRNVGKHAAGAIVGSALVEVLGRGEDPAAFLQGLR